MAKLEWAHIEAFDAAEKAPLSLAQAASLGFGSKLALQPHIQLLELHSPVENILLAVRRPKANFAELSIAQRKQWLTGFRAPRKPWLVVHRADFSVHYKRVEKQAFLLLAALSRGLSIADAIEHSFADVNGTPEACARKVQKWFADWSRMGWICLAVQQ